MPLKAQAGRDVCSRGDRQVRSREITIGGLLTAVSLLIPLYFRGTLQIAVPNIGFSATLGSHVPTMLAMAVSPLVALGAGVGSAVGFWITLGPIVGSRAATHIVWGVIGALVYQRSQRMLWALAVALPIHALGEGLVVWIGTGTFQNGLIVTGTTLVHHALDSAITLALLPLLRPAMELKQA